MSEDEDRETAWSLGLDLFTNVYIFDLSLSPETRKDKSARGICTE